MQNKRDYYLGNPNLPTENSKFEWTPKMLADLKKAKQNLLYFAENFFKFLDFVLELQLQKDFETIMHCCYHTVLYILHIIEKNLVCI